MWFIKAKNLFALDFNHFLNITNKLSIPNIKDELEEFEILEYKMIDVDETVRTLHGQNKDNSIALTIYPTHLEAFIFNSEQNYTLRIGSDNLYKVELSVYGMIQTNIWISW